jgi:hypothetical protein
MAATPAGQAEPRARGREEEEGHGLRHRINATLGDSGSQVCVSGCHRRSNCAGPVPLKSTPSIGVENPSPPDCHIVPPMSAENVLATVVSVGAPPSGGGGKTADPQLSKALAVTQRLPPPNGCNSRSSSWSSN